ncbi:N(5)-(carboxyethyl)ornithine synthase [Paraclostridium sordellii]|uniref:N(5)-(carboxyethyl)ornithine synthase n=1 Tax=Paraclostridium sordellii TaxID=1505 RepID=UPI001F06880D|nr:N(5)-(carboxyethyl)ornithine synthase [Paeniclostridium sordellii]MCH1967202.1 N(5)-(carboxyethyl)ornithine synthase [Paeniclostridium sordellii]
MRSIGFLISLKENEERRALIPEHICNIKNKNMLFFEKGYGEKLGYKDQDYINMGANIVDREEVLKKDVLCDPKIGDSDYLDNLLKGQILFGWIHAVQNKNITENILKNKCTAIAWEDMYEYGKHVFWKNNEIAGEASILHAYSLYKKMPYDTKVAILGKGNTGRGALNILKALGADVTVYDRKTEELFKHELHKYDVIVNTVLWDLDRLDHIIYREDLKRMKKGSMIIDISCDTNGGIETSKSTTIENPIYYEEDILHYVVDNIPSLYYKTVSKSLSEEVCKYIDLIVEEKEKTNKTLKQAIIISQGNIIDERINKFQNRV